MKKILYAPLCASLLLVACDDKPDLKPADQAEKSFKALQKAQNDYYQGWATIHPMINSLTNSVESYEKGEVDSSSKTKVSSSFIDVNDNKSFNINFDHKVKYDKDTLSDGVVAQVITHIEPSEDTREEGKKILSQLEITTNIKKDDSFTSTTILKPYNFASESEQDDESLNFNGLDIVLDSSVENLSNGFIGQYAVNFKGATQKADSFNFESFSLKGAHKDNGDISLQLDSPITVTREDAKFTLNKLSAEGNVKLNPEYQILLGQAKYELGDMQITNPSKQVFIGVDKLTVETDSSINGKDIVSSKMQLKLIPNADTVKAFSQGMLDVSELNASFAMDNIPAQVLKDYNSSIAEFYKGIDSSQGANKEEFEAKAKKIFDSLKSANADISFNTNVLTSDGKINMEGTVVIKSDSTTTFDELVNALSPNVILEVLDVNIDVSIPASLLEKTGLQMLAATFLQKNGDVYESKITTQDGKLLINGVPAQI